MTSNNQYKFKEVEMSHEQLTVEGGQLILAYHSMLYSAINKPVPVMRVSHMKIFPKRRSTLVTNVNSTER